MKKIYLASFIQKQHQISRLLKFATCAFFVFFGTRVNSQCSTTFTPATSCASADQIQSFTLDGISAVGNAGCSPNAYGLFNSPVWNLTIGNTYSWTITNGPTWSQGVAIWIDLNNDGFLTSNEQLANDPSGLTHTGTLTIPFGSAAGNNIRMRLRCQFATTISNTNSTACDPWTFGETEDYFVNLISPTPCSGVPAANSVITPSFAICPNSSANLSLANTYTVGGITYAWQSSTVSAVGPFVAVPGGTNSSLTTPNLTVNTFYQVVATCTNAVGSTSAAAGQVSVSPVIVDTIPYFESFENIGVDNKLPNCSWAASNLPTNCKTYITSNTLGRMPRSGTSFASFYYSPAGTYYFYSNGLQLTAGITYSAAVHYQTEYYGYNNWTDLSIMLGTSQSSTGLVTIASTNGPAVSNVYKSLSNTFSVATSGLYYIAIKASATTSGAQYLSWDDLSVTIPCNDGSPNLPNLSVAANNLTICAGDQVNLTAAGADSYSWNTGSNSASISDFPTTSTSYIVTGKNNLTGCSSSTVQTIVVNTAPSVLVFADKQSVCPGFPAVISALGSSATYAWSNAATGQAITVTPTVTTSYTVIASGSNGCVGTAVQVINVLDLPTVSASTDRPDIMCINETAVLTAAGTAVSYQWISNTSSALLMGNPVSVSPSSTSVYTVTGTGANGCQSIATVAQTVLECTAITEQTRLSGLNLYPNPTKGEFSVESNNTLNKTIEVVDVNGKIVATSTSNLEVVHVNIKNLANGIYYVKIQSNNSVEVIKLVKE